MSTTTIYPPKTDAPNGAFINFTNIDNLRGQLLTYIDATYQDPVQRDAHKSLVKQITRDWYYGCESDNPIRVVENEESSDGAVGFKRWREMIVTASKISN